MGNIMTRAALAKIMADENLTPEQRTEQVMSLYGRALDDGYISKSESALLGLMFPFDSGTPQADLNGGNDEKLR